MSSLVSAVAQNNTSSGELILNQTKACVATPAILVAMCPEKPAPCSRDGIMMLFCVRVLEKKSPPEVSAVPLAAMVGDGCRQSLEQQPRVPALSSPNNIPSPTSGSKREEGAAALARINKTWCLRAWLPLCFGHEATVSRASVTCLVAHAGSRLALMSLQGLYLAHWTSVILSLCSGCSSTSRFCMFLPCPWFFILTYGLAVVFKHSLSHGLRELQGSAAPRPCQLCPHPPVLSFQVHREVCGGAG